MDLYLHSLNMSSWRGVYLSTGTTLPLLFTLSSDILSLWSSLSVETNFHTRTKSTRNITLDCNILTSRCTDTKYVSKSICLCFYLEMLRFCISSTDVLKYFSYL